MTKFYPLEVEGRGGETQPQVGNILIIELTASRVNHYPAKLIYLKNILKVVFRYRDTQLKVGENY